MEKCLLSIDWDYFIFTKKDNWGSFLENNRSLIDLWYKRYIQGLARGENIQLSFRLSSELDVFWDRIKKHFKFLDDTKVYVSDSHSLSYCIAKENNCRIVYLFDSHADLGYGGLSSLDFEVNCSNWLGKLLKDKQIIEANIFYSPYTAENPKYFKQMNMNYNIRYCNLNDLDKMINTDISINADNSINSDKSINAEKSIDVPAINISAIHICRSGAWTPPWLDEKFAEFIEALGMPYEIVDCPERKWDPENISFSDQVNYLMA